MADCQCYRYSYFVRVLMESRVDSVSCQQWQCYINLYIFKIAAYLLQHHYSMYIVVTKSLSVEISPRPYHTYAIITTMKSSQFHPSRKYVCLFKISPLAVIFNSISTVYMLWKTFLHNTKNRYSSNNIKTNWSCIQPNAVWNNKNKTLSVVTVVNIISLVLWKIL